TCNPQHHCLIACDDSSAATGTCPNTPAGAFYCQGSGGITPDHVCVQCLTSAECGLSPRACLNNAWIQCSGNGDSTPNVCDPNFGRCVDGADSRDCRAGGTRLCTPATHMCVAGGGEPAAQPGAAISCTSLASRKASPHPYPSPADGRG